MNEDQDRVRRLRTALSDIHWSTETLAQVAGIRPNSVRRIVAGNRPVSDWLLIWLEDLAAYHRTHPVPPPPAAPDETEES